MNFLSNLSFHFQKKIKIFIEFFRWERITEIQERRPRRQEDRSKKKDWIMSMRGWEKDNGVLNYFLECKSSASMD